MNQINPFLHHSTIGVSQKAGMAGYRVKPLTSASGSIIQGRWWTQRDRGGERGGDIGERETERKRQRQKEGKREATPWRISSNKPLKELVEADFSVTPQVRTLFLNSEQTYKQRHNTETFIRKLELKPESLGKLFIVCLILFPS